MKAFSLPLPLLPLALAPALALGAQEPTISGPFTELRAAPVFAAETQKLSKNWGPSLPVGQAFRVEKVYGRWLYGTPEPRSRMKESEFAKPGWVFSRMLLVPGDENTLSPAVNAKGQAVIYHSRLAWMKLGLGKPPLVSTLDFLEGLTLSKGTMAAFRQQDEKPLAFRFPALPSFLPPGLRIPEVRAEEKSSPSMGLSGTDLSFLDQEFRVLKKKKQAEEQKKRAQTLKPPPLPALNEEFRTAILGRFMLQKYLEFPALTHEEVDGHIYMRAVAYRALEGCPKEIKDYWKNRRWNLFRVYRMKSRPEIAHPLLEVALPGGYFGFSGKSIDLAGNEAELAFLLVRPLVREPRIRRKKIKFLPKQWPGQLQSASEELWDEALRAQSTKESENLDVADEIAVDIAAVECISRGGYRPMAGLSFLRKLASKKEEPWARWMISHSIGLDYRIERLTSLMEEALSHRKFPEGKVSNIKRFSTASRHWNLLP